MDKVVTALTGKHLQKLLYHFNPLDLDDPHVKWLKEATLTQAPILNLDTFVEKKNNPKRWYHEISEPGRNPYLLSGGRQGEYFGNYIFALNALVDCPIPYDRTDEFNMLNLHVEPIPEVPKNWNKSFSDVVCERANEIWNMNRPVRLWWSGGIDSTTALISLLETATFHDDLTVYMSLESVKENPNMYEDIKKLQTFGHLKVQWHDGTNTWDFNNWNDGSINVTGEPGDPCWGTYVVEHHINEINDPWTDIFKWEDSNLIFREDDYRCNYHRPKFMEFAENFAKKCPFEVKNAFDFTWWLAFACKWQWISTRIYPQMPNPSKWDNMIGFYSSDQIQIWSIVNHDLKHKGSWKTYKWPAKEFIYSYNKDATYRDHKVKEKSLPRTVPMRLPDATQYLIMTSGDYYTKQDEIDPSISKYDKWDIFNKSLWEQWKLEL
jgi:hypothetical protein